MSRISLGIKLLRTSTGNGATADRQPAMPQTDQKGAHFPLETV